MFYTCLTVCACSPVILYIAEYIHITRPKKHFKNEQRSTDAAAQKRANTSGVGKINNYCEYIYIYTSLIQQHPLTTPIHGNHTHRFHPLATPTSC